MAQAPDLFHEMPQREPMQTGQGTAVRSQPAKGAASDSAGNLHPAPLWMAGAGYLLYWPCVHEMLHDLLDREGIKNRTEFPIQLEEQRGLLLAYREGKRMYIYETAEIPRDVDCSPTGSPAQRYSSGSMSGIRPEGITGSRTLLRNQRGPADFSEPTVWTYVKSFEQNIHIMHPIILPQEIRDMVQRFLDSIPKPSKDFATTATFVPQPLHLAAFEIPETRRNRLPGPGPRQMQYRTGRPAHTIGNAVVLTILALGKICLYRESIPNVVCSKDHQSQGIWNDDPSSSAHASFPGVYHPSASSSSSILEETERPTLRHQHSSEAGSGSSVRAMYDAVPGLEYFEMATDIISYELGGTTLDHVYANLFAGLSLERFSALGSQEPSLEENRLLFAFWTGLQLESDIIAEIPRHQSGILRLDNNFPYPNVDVWLRSWIQGEPSASKLANSVMRSYIAQLYLRRHLNWIHSDIYTITTSPVDPPDLLREVRKARDLVAGLKWVPNTHTFTENDPPATDILSARLRAKYWGSQVVTYRPCIKLILDLSYKLRYQEAALRRPIVILYEDLQPDTINQVESLPQGVWEYARKGIRALVESTQAFHGLGFKRPIITNVFGTAHAQWGNLVVLAACYRDPFLRKEIDRNKLRDLFERTIYFLWQVSTPDSALRVDQRLLEGIYQKLFFTS
ncbi:uncharacterized protein DNG_03519 [Cephalotrichum gorgonifer]|uniref:Uncharacterized protein n=1 Tax=Cephalotrichum gorgonifer TaxID=2041049 RepID=A0AAE8MWP1_9PEZI|nr:uncharacterized protein DNG_03519 [Cephalotrichum gorgonifer]